MRMAGRKRRQVTMTTAELRALAKMVIDEGVKARDAALLYNVKPRMVWTLVRKV